ncbi:LOW QUALITY PROTEIN: hypothetical protein Cgig2_016679 [Carnegiea gigantea]|uniref:Avr9/Cf-9 rapidly elicited protein n=1 Tax=Carnegiea gigantea TaxID=171969 RepID=A0A9Q1QR00_9CARY|nr:LOW QUALITY PROTEIN: hypothetical protein Cgig2_016679 [Carnegiea gigantea]
MEQKAPSIAKKIWHIVKVAFFMLRKGICKRKILLDLNIMMKRSKLAGKAIQNLMFHHHHSSNYAAAANPEEYEFSCSNTPLHRRYFNKKKSHHEPRADVVEVNKVFEMMMTSSSSSSNDNHRPLGFGQSPVTRQLRITDSPYPLQDNPDEDSRVDEAAEDFINKFYSQLKQQKYY